MEFLFSPFLLDTQSLNQPSFFEIAFFLENKQYVLNFEIFENKIVSENLIEIKTNENIELYKRNNQNFKIHKSFEKEGKK